MSDKPIPERCPACDGTGLFEWFGHAESTDGFESENPDDKVPRNRSKPCRHCYGTGRSTWERLQAAESRVRELEQALQSFPKMAQECLHDEEVGYCVLCHSEFDRAVSQWILLSRNVALASLHVADKAAKK